MSDAFLAHSDLKQGDVVSPLLLNCVLAFVIKKIH
jgi:hypothetical protein